MAIKGIFLDFDNTMMGTEKVSLPTLIERFNDIYNDEIDTPLDMDIFGQYFHGKGRQNLCKALSEYYGIDVDYGNLYKDRQKNIMSAHKKNGVPMAPHLLETLTKFHDQGLTLALVSNNSIQINLTAMRYADNGQGNALVQLFGTLLFEAGDIQKPDPDVYHRALQEACLDPSEVIAIEDSKTGVQSATKAGITTFGFTGFMTNKDNMAQKLTKAGAAKIFDDFTELPSLIPKLA